LINWWKRTRRLRSGGCLVGRYSSGCSSRNGEYAENFNVSVSISNSDRSSSLLIPSQAFGRSNSLQSLACLHKTTMRSTNNSELAHFTNDRICHALLHIYKSTTKKSSSTSEPAHSYMGNSTTSCKLFYFRFLKSISSHPSLHLISLLQNQYSLHP
jgi:hypothetical protein